MISCSGLHKLDGTHTPTHECVCMSVHMCSRVFLPKQRQPIGFSRFKNGFYTMLRNPVASFGCPWLPCLDRSRIARNPVPAFSGLWLPVAALGGPWLPGHPGSALHHAPALGCTWLTGRRSACQLVGFSFKQRQLGVLSRL